MHEGDDKSIQNFCQKLYGRGLFESLRINEDNIETDL